MNTTLTPENILLNLMDYFTEKVRGERISKITSTVGDSIVTELTKYNEHDRQIIFTGLKSSNYTPNLYGIKKIVENESLHAESTGFTKQYVNLCECGCYYAQQDEPMSAYCCPKCGETERTITDYPGKGEVIIYNKFCVISQKGKVRCGRFKQKMTMRTNGINSDCRGYGKGEKLDKCKDCQCKECCEYAHDHEKDVLKVDVAELINEWKDKYKIINKTIDNT